MQVKLVLHIVSEEDAVKRQTNVVNDVVNDVVNELTERQFVILTLIMQDKFITAKRMSVIMSEKEFIHERTIQRELAILKDLGVVSRIGGRNNGYWEINKELLPSLYRVIGDSACHQVVDAGVSPP